MSDFLEEIQRGKRGENVFIKSPFEAWDKSIGTIQKKKIYLVGAYTKTGKTSWVDFFYILNPYLHMEEYNRLGITLKWRYYSYEIDRVSKMANFTTFFLWKLYRIRADVDYILGFKEDKITEDIEDKIKFIYENHLIKLFGVYDKYGIQEERGLIDFFEAKMTPREIKDGWVRYAKEHGEVIYGNEGGKRIPIVYNQYDPKLFTIGIFDHVGLIPKQKGYSKKENLDKFSQYLVELRNFFGFTFIPISQFNRGLGKTDRIKFAAELLQPSLEDFKDTGNLAEDANTVIALFNPSAYPHIDNHLGYDINKLQRYYRSSHILANRGKDSNVNMAFFMDVVTKDFQKLPEPDSQAMQDSYRNIRNLTTTEPL